MSSNPDLNKQAQKVINLQAMIKSFYSHICFNNILGICLNGKMYFHYHVLVRNVQINARNRCH